MMRNTIGIVLLLLLFGCSDKGTFHITIQFPEVRTEEAKERTQQVRVMVIEASENANCQALLDGTNRPDDDDYPLEDEVDIGYPGMEGARPLETKGTGPRLFFAEGLDEDSLVILRGCVTVQAEEGSPREVIILLDWAEQPCENDVECDDGQWCTGEEHCLDGRCESETRDCSDGDVCTQDVCNEDLKRCENPPLTEPPAQEGPIGDASCDDETDNDCDGLTDEDDPGCIPCTQDHECQDFNACTSDLCVEGQCANEPVADGTVCDDGLYCTVNDECTLGRCGGGLRDCSQVEDQCNRSVCDEMGGLCMPIPLTEGTGCDDGLWCTENDACGDGTCLGQTRDCSEYASECVAGVCNEDARLCEAQEQEDGTECNDELYCNIGETCQSGSCAGGVARNCGASGGGCVDGTCDENLDECVGDPLEAGTPCNDEVNCTVYDVCDDNGHCDGTTMDCSALSNQCNLGLCEEDTGTCVRQTINEGLGCDDGLYCTTGESCQSGICTGGTDLICNDDDSCTRDSCDEANDVCDFDLVEIPGTEGLSIDGTCDDQIDNDCDRLLDGDDPDCQECNENSDCEDSNPCTINACVDSHCETSMETDGTPCDDGEYCTDPDTCTAGSCGGLERGCSSLDDPCNQGLCNETDNECQAQPINEGQACDDGFFCNVDEACLAGSCEGGTARDCSAFAEECLNPLCDEDLDACITIPKAPGVQCQDGIGCTTGDICDADGNCAGTPTDSFCMNGGEQCRPLCFSAPSGCGLPPSDLVLLCAPNPVDLSITDTTYCDLALGPTGQADCIHCHATLGMTTLDRVGFDDCDLGGWSLISGNECSTAVIGCLSSGTEECCAELTDICGEYNGDYYLHANEATHCLAGSASSEQFRLQKIFDFAGLANNKVCFEIADWNADSDEGVLVYACDAANGCEQVFCLLGEPQPDVRWVYYRYCATLPLWADDNSAVTIKFVVHSDDPEDIIYLDDLSVRGWSIGCEPTYSQVFVEEFADCPSPLSVDWNGWTVTGEVQCITNLNDCYDASERIRVTNTSASIERIVDASTLDDDIELCFYYGDDNADLGDTLTVEFDTGTGWQTVWYQDDNPGPDNSCRQICVNLTDMDPEVNNNPSVGIRFSMLSDISGDRLHLDHITLSGAVYCDDSGLLEIGAINDNGDGTYFFSARDIPGTSLRTDIECHWAEPETGIAGLHTVLFRE